LKNAKFNEEQVLFIVTNVALWKTDRQILNLFKEKYNMDISKQNVHTYRYSASYQPLVEQIRDEFERDIKQVEFASKRRRIEELTDIFNNCKEKSKFKEAIACMASIREEVDGKRINGDVYMQFNQFSNMSDVELRKKVEENAIELKRLEENKFILEGNHGDQSTEDGTENP